MKILTCNDDGIRAPGIVLMANRLAELGHDVTVVAPDGERSGKGHSITTTSLHIGRRTFPEYDKRLKVFQTNGAPADCATLGVEVAAPGAELVISGINRGSNMGLDVFYSGTVGAAREGYFENIPSIAVSLCMDEGARDAEDHYETAVFAVETLIADMDAVFGEKREAALLNVNVPNLPLSELKGFKTVFTGLRRYQNRIQVCEAPLGHSSYWRRPSKRDREEGSDIEAVADGYVALTFLRHDTTDYDLNARMDGNLSRSIQNKT